MKFGYLCWLTAIISILACSNELKHPPGKLYGTVTLSPEPTSGENWAYLRASSHIAEYTITSDPVSHAFAFEDLQVEDLITTYYIEAYREGYISYGDSIDIEAGVTISHFDIVLQRGARQDHSFQDDVSPESTYFGCMDTYISSTYPTEYYGSDSTLIAAGGSSDSLSRALINFSFSWPQYYPSIDTFPRVVESAKLSIFVDSVLTTGSFQIAVFNLEQGFNETMTNWTHNGPNPWPGGPGGSWGQYSSDTLSVNGATYGWIEFSIENIAEQWLLNSSSGPMMIKLIDESRASAIYMRSADNDVIPSHPILRLAINYLQ